MNTEKIVNNFKKIFNKIKYIIEFISVLILCVLIYKFITIKAYEGYWSRNYLILSCIIGIFSIGIIIYNCIKDKDKIENMFINFAIPIGIMYIVFMLPSYTPDASSHIWKSYEVSKGIFFTKIDENGDSKTEVPEVLSIYRETVLTKYNVLNTVFKLPDSYNYEKTIKEDCPSKGYCFIYFIVYSIGFFIARIFSLNIYIGLYLGRILNFILVLFLGYISIKKIPFAKILLATYLLIPMLVQQATAISVDSLMNSILILFIAYSLNLAFKKDKLLVKEKVVFLLLTIFIGISKITYVPLLGIGLILAKRRKEMLNKEKILLAFLAIIICLGSMTILNKLNSGYTNETAKAYLSENDVNTNEQLNGILTNPINYLKVLANNFIVNGDFYLINTIGGYMGWQTIGMPFIFIMLYVILLLASIYVEKNDEVIDKFEKIWMFFLASAMFLLIITGFYLEWTKVGENYVLGVQGRYFLPIMIMFLLIFSKKDNYIKIKNPNIKILLSSLIINILFISRVILFFI